MKSLEKLLFTFLVGAFLSSCPNTIPTQIVPILSNSTPTPELKYNYTTTTELAESEYVNSSEGGAIEVTSADNLINGTKLIIPAQALSENTLISISQVNNPPMLPNGLNYVGAPIDLGPDGINFNTPLTIEIPYSDSSLHDAGISDTSNLRLYSYNKSSNNWSETDITSINTENHTITAELNHFSYYSITCLGTTPPEDLGHPQPGDLVFATGAFWEPTNETLKNSWLPGHVGIYVGNKVDKFGDDYNVIEAQGNHMTLIGNVKRSIFKPLSNFSNGGGYMGAREPKYFILTQQQRKDIVEYAEAQIGKPYAFFQTFGALFGLARGSLVKGPNTFNCVGLAEAAYEYAGVNGGEGLVNWLDEDWPPIEFGISAAVLTPAEYYNQTRPAEGSAIGTRGPAGGWIFYDKGNNSDGWRYLETAPVDQTSRAWGTLGINISGANEEEIGTGKQNTLDIIVGDSAINKAADECANYSNVNNGIIYDDWFLPSMREVCQMYLNLKLKGIGDFSNDSYWSSSEYRDNTAWFNYFDNSSITTTSYKSAVRCVRAIRETN